MKTIKGPGIFLAQFYDDNPPFNNLANLADWASNLGYKGFQVPTWGPALIDLEKAAESKGYCDEVKGILQERGIELIEIASYLQGQCMAIHPAYEAAFSVFYPKGMKGKDVPRWAEDQLKKSVLASKNLGTSNISSFSGALAWPMVYPWPQRPQGLIDEAFTELARRWKPVFDFAQEHGVTISFELHPGEDLHDGATFEMFLDKLDGHPVPGITYDPSHFVLQQLDYAEFIRLYHERIRAFHVKDAEFRPDGRVGVYGGFQGWNDRAGRFRSLGDGQVDFKRIFTLLSEYDYDGWAIMEWECCVKSPEQGAREGAPFIADHIIEVTEKAFDDFAGGEVDRDLLRRMLGLD